MPHSFVTLPPLGVATGSARPREQNAVTIAIMDPSGHLRQVVDPNPYAPPMAPIVAGPRGDGGFVIEGDQVTVPLALPLPELCVKCGQAGGLTTRQQKFRWVPPWTNLLFLVGLLPAVVLQAVLTKRARVSLPICPRCDARWSKATLLIRLALFGPIVATTIAVVVALLTDWGALLAGIAFLLMVPTILIAPALIYFVLLRPRSLRCTRLDARAIKLSGLSPAVLDAVRGQARTF